MYTASKRIVSSSIRSQLRIIDIPFLVRRLLDKPHKNSIQAMDSLVDLANKVDPLVRCSLCLSWRLHIAVSYFRDDKTLEGTTLS